MRNYTVKRLAELSGVSVRTLHHYDEIGLLKPAHVGSNGYRYYGRTELLRLQQILFHRELGLSLDEIRKVLDAPDFDQATALRRHRRKLEEEIRRCQRLIETIDASLKGDGKANEKAFFKGLDPESWAEQDRWAIERYGAAAEVGIKGRDEVMSAWTQADYDRHAAGFQAVWNGFERAHAQKLPVEEESVQGIARDLWGLIGEASPRPLSVAAFLAVADVYAEHPQLRSRLDARASGLTDYAVNAMRSFSKHGL